MKAGEWQYICVANHQGKAEEDGKGAMQEVSPIIWYIIRVVSVYLIVSVAGSVCSV